MKKVVNFRVTIFVISLSFVFFLCQFWRKNDNFRLVSFQWSSVFASTTIPKEVDPCGLTTLSPPVLTADERSVLNSHISFQADPSKVLSALSNVVQRQIQRINSPTNCSSTKSLVCGLSFGVCGFGCQFHHRAACLLMSYALSIPLIHESDKSWSYSTKWEEIFLPLGSSCTPTKQSYYWTWWHTKEYYTRIRKEASSGNFASDFKWDPCKKDREISTSHKYMSDHVDLAYPLIKGIVVDEEIAGYVGRYTQNSHLWWIGQFIMHGLQLNSKAQKNIEDNKTWIGLTPDCIGLHVRRTDKKEESEDSYHNLSEYFDKVYRITNTSGISSGGKWQVYLATDDPSVFNEAKQQFTDLEILGFPIIPGTGRKDSLDYMIRDIYLLHSCKHIICGLNSNICRLLLEMRSYSDHFHSTNRITSLHGSYAYVLNNHDLESSIYSIG